MDDKVRGDNVVRLGADLPENLMTLEKHRHVPFYCEHPAIRLDAHERMVHCTKCGARLDPFDFLHSNARTITSAWHNYDQAKAQVRDIAERISVLKKEEKRLRGVVKRLQDKSGEVLSVRPKII